MKNKATNSAYMKFSNRRLVLDLIRKKPASRAELARITGLTRAAVTLMTDELIKEGVLMETGTAEADYGRKPILLDLNPRSYYAVGISLTRSGCNAGIIDIRGKCALKLGINLASHTDAGECLKIIAGSVNRVIKDSALPVEKFLGIGVSTPGPVDINTGTILNPPNFNQWHNTGIVQGLKESLPFPTFLENNSTGLALSEKNYGAGAGYGSFMLLVVDTGIGAGIIINDSLYRGVRGFGSEVGHTSVDINGKRCSCGNRGCLEFYASIPSVIKNISRYDSNIKAWDEIVDRALKGDELCIKAMDREARYLSAGIVNAMNILELEAVILTGDINYKPQMLLDKIREYVGGSAITGGIHKLHIVNSPINEDSGVISAASVVFEKFFKGEL